MSVAAAFPGLDVTTEDAAVLSSDIAAAARHPAAAVLHPASIDDIVTIVRIARREGIALHPRGGGWSYTGGYRPGERPSVLVDSRRLTGIVPGDGVVTAGAGLTWAELHAALEAKGLRAASFGPLSGFGATIGGGAAQNGGFFGAAGHGAFGDGAITASTLVDGTGAVRELTLADRADGLAAPQPLVGDCGGFGIRATVTLRTIPIPPATRFASFNFPSGAAALDMLLRLVGWPGLGEAYVFDPGTHRNLARSGFSVIESAGLAGDLLSGTGGWRDRIGGLLRTARAGKAFVADLAWSLHVSFDGTAAETAAAQAEATRLALENGGELVPDVIPRVTRARPFRRIKALLGPDGEAWLPVHGVFAPAQAQAALQAVAQTLAETPDIKAVILLVAMGGRVIIEPQLFWPDALTPVVRRMATAEQVAAFGARPANPAARQVAHDLRQRLIGTLDAAGASHFQIGRTYAALHPAWPELKRRYDPDALMNPGVLGLGA